MLTAKFHSKIFSFENAGDYIMDVGWSPIHPALFASADLTGKLSFWNLNTDTEVGNFLINNPHSYRRYQYHRFKWVLVWILHLIVFRGTNQAK